jgi:ring-1,2-phenylacetyl-CoA epoxidase subunit PaaD
VDLATLAREVAGTVADPELPMLTLADLGILRDVVVDGERVEVALTPTYLGCPALHEMASDVTARLRDAGFTDVIVRTVLTPPWTSDLVTDEGRRKLAAAGIAPPRPARPVPMRFTPRQQAVPCPRCGSADTEQNSPFGATSCRALRRCRACLEPFEYMREI